MIFVTLGSQKFQFNRLLKSIDELVLNGDITDEVFAQIGCSDYYPLHYKYKDFLDREEFAKKQDEADIVITHGGTGAIVGALKKGKKVIAVPRLSKFGEHVDDHQLQITQQFKELNLICECQDVEKIGESLEYVRKTSFNRYKSNTTTIISSIEEFINE